MTEKRFIADGIMVRDIEGEIPTILTHNEEQMNKFLSGLNALHEKNQELKSELKVYRKIASCSNCKYHNYDWYDDGDEFEICEKGNDVDDRICKDWKEFW